MRIFLTGASGFVGSAAARHLRYADHELRAMARSDRSANHIRGLRAATVRCSLEDVEAAHLEDCDAVVHCAAMVGDWGTRELFARSNISGTARLLAAARAAGVRRFIHISTEAVLFHGQHLRDIDEGYAPPAGQSPYAYCASKAEAERLVLAANAPDFATLALRPRLVWGPGDSSILPGILRMIESGGFAWLDGGTCKTSTLHIDNLAHAIGLAVEHAPAGEAYFITDGEVWTYRDFFGRLIATQGVDIPARTMPGWAARGLAAVLEPLWRIGGRKTPPPLTRLAAAMMTRECTLRIDKARAAFGYEPQLSVETGLSFIPRRSTD